MPRAKSKFCRGECQKKRPVKVFSKSKLSKDGLRNYCVPCWSKKLSKGHQDRRKKVANGVLPPKKSGGRRTNGDPTSNGNGVDHINEALSKANSKGERFMVRAADGESKEFRNEGKALRQAMLWQIDGYAPEIWRKCDFELVARIRG